MRTPFMFHRCLIVVSLITGVSSLQCFIKAECRTNATVFNTSCTVLCPPNCAVSFFPIWGAGRYSLDSSICRAAIHDVRLNGAAESFFNITVERKPMELITFHSLIRNQITSLRRNELTAEYFIFTSPRLTELIDDITLMFKIPVSDRITYVECYHRNNKTQKPPEMGVIGSKFNCSNEAIIEFAKLGQGFRTRYYFIINATSEKEYGIVYCTSKSRFSAWSFVTASLLNSQIHFQPEKFTTTVNIGDSVNINMIGNNVSSGLRPVWFKDNLFLQSFYSNISYKNVQLGHTGFYTLDYVYMRNSHKGTMKIIVRDCKKDRYGNECSKTCPPCLNGGICHDTTGICICPPGFMGELCEIGCGPNRFGRNCDASCEELDNVNACKGKLLCIPDPYGCSCATGFFGLKCDQKCDIGFYGAGCTENCSDHCKVPKTCDIFTGQCDNSCQNGWKGESCQFSAPLYLIPPIIKRIDSITIHVMFRPWKYGSDIGKGKVANYRIEYKDKLSSEQWHHEVIPTKYWLNKKENIVYYLNVSNNNDIQVRIRIQENEIWHTLASPIAEVIPHTEDKFVEVSHSSTVGKIVGGTLAFLVLCIIILVIYLKRCHKKNSEGTKGKENANCKKPESVPLMEKQ